MTTKTDGYDPSEKAEDLIAPLRRWAKFGFLRGFAGIRKEIVPEGEMVLPSKAFMEAARENLKDLDDKSQEFRERMRYVTEVEAILRRQQRELIDAHWRNSLLGHVGDLLLALVFVALMVALVVKVGPFSWLTIGLIGLIGIKILFLQVSVNKALRIAQKAFMFEKSNIAFPWDDVHQAK